jgi:hypothetical protein
MRLKLIHLWPFLAYIVTVPIAAIFFPVEWIATATPFVGVVGATAYMLMFSTRRWQDDQFTRAMMLQAFTLWLMFLYGAIRLSITGRPAVVNDDGLAMAFLAWSFNVLILISVWYKAVALYRQIRQGYLDDLARN